MILRYNCLMLHFSPRRIALRVTPDAQAALRHGHPWLFAGSIVAQNDAGVVPQAGDLAVIFDDYRRFLAIGLYDPASPIRVRVLQHRHPVVIDAAFFAGRVQAALTRRAALLADPLTTGLRLLHGESDGLPGVVVDRYHDVQVLKLYSAAWVPHLPVLLEVLAAAAPAARMVLRLSRAVQAQAEALGGLADGVTLVGEPPQGPVVFLENGLRFEADVLHGQKTGFFLDQRDNRARVGELAQGRSTLNVFAYTGGFSLYAARGAAPAVISVDIAAPAMAAAARNFALNLALPAVAAAQHTLLVEDAFVALRRLANEGRRFGLVVVDPPAFAKQQSEISAALQAYTRLAALAARVTEPGGLLVMASCSSRVAAEAFFGAVRRGALQVGTRLQEFDHTGHPLDHPVSFAEGAYLKCLYASVHRL